ncbi:flagellar hook-associated protein FlgK [Nocardioides sp. YIM 152315]|uniref:flagellar hook-associated protein FlgK n=1 Tax=Nocardioides sp. YIM 152315 TaxID=3031760 RepID=UPI0023D9FB70|nr:flagellar hook-associated protein FlgK [Nocardioides sp. YIM 152315]MDF1605952.1 flagellar hook-associated protein FlgK [Nocardioides sp. YIM 152315]
MSSPFSSLNTALSALRYQQAALDIASTNVANASTEGYVRRRVVGETVGAAAAPAVWSRSNEIGSGVQPSGVQRLVDPLLDMRVRREHGRQSYLDLKGTAMSRVETGIAEPSDKGVAKAIETFKNSIADLENAPNTDAARAQVLANGAVVADAFAIQARNVQDELGDQRARVVATVQEVNDLAQQLASTNKTIAGSTGGGDTATLMDTRDQLALRLAELTGATATVRSDGGMDVKLGGQALVQGGDASTLTVTPGKMADGVTDDPDKVGFALTSPAGVTAVVAPADGELAASAELINSVLPDYVAELNALVTDFADAFNAAHDDGYDAGGLQGGQFFAYDASNPAGTLEVLITDTSKIALSAVPPPPPPAVPVGNTDTGNAANLADSITIQDGYQRLVNGFGTDVASVKRLADNQSVMSSQVDAAREQLAGVSIDEESVNMVMAQRSYEAAARVMTTVDSILDTLINRTGLVGR